ncbi:nucleolar complex protein 14 [Bulinus truncatus]|nr:nucleolar complex protein 14 [Bulinus truncatus]
MTLDAKFQLKHLGNCSIGFNNNRFSYEKPKHVVSFGIDEAPAEKQDKDEISKGCSKAIEKIDLPFIFPAPGSYIELKSLLHGHSAEEQAIIIFTRLRKCHHPSLAEGNKEKLERFHLCLLEYFGELFQQESVEKQLVNSVTLNIWEMTQMFPVSTATFFQLVVSERQKIFAAIAQKKGGRGTFVPLDTLMYLTLIELLFPTSDFKHPVTTPAVHFITQILSESTIRNSHDVVAGLFLSSLALKYINQSKRYIPEVITFLHGVLYLSTEKHPDMKVFLLVEHWERIMTF